MALICRHTTKYGEYVLSPDGFEEKKPAWQLDGDHVYYRCPKCRAINKWPVQKLMI